MVKLEKFIFDLNGKKVELTPEEVSDLYLQLKKFHGEPEYIPVPQPYPTYPWLPYTPWATTTGDSFKLKDTQIVNDAASNFKFTSAGEIFRWNN